MAEQKEQVQEASDTQPAQPAKKRAAPRRKASKKVEKAIFVKSKRKSAVARASAKRGTGKIKVNGFDINIMEPIELRKLMLEPISVSKITQDIAMHTDIKVRVYGGGPSSQAQAVRGAIAKSIAASAESDTVRKEYMRYDRFMLIDDSRRVEPKKFKGPKARARFQKSYR